LKKSQKYLGLLFEKNPETFRKIFRKTLGKNPRYFSLSL
jgi:hypothetical protein